jgi:hypothetical protein
MRRRPELVSLSWDHHPALEVALRLRRTTEATLAGDVGRAMRFFGEEAATHMRLEDHVVLPALGDPVLAAQVAGEHVALRAAAGRLREAPSVDAARALGADLAGHVRFEERIVFPALESRLAEDALAEVGALLH